MSLVIAVACEADADFLAASTLIDRTLLENVSWVEQELLTHLRQFVAENPPYEWTRIQSVPAAILSKKLRVTPGKFRGEPGAPDALLARKTIVLLNSLNPQPQVLVVMRDIDKEPGRQIGWNQARDEYHGRPPLVLGIAIIKRENWILAGFRLRDHDEQLRLQEERQTLGYDPILHPDQPNSMNAVQSTAPNACWNIWWEQRESSVNWSVFATRHLRNSKLAAKALACHSFCSRFERSCAHCWEQAERASTLSTLGFGVEPGPPGGRSSC